MSTRSSIVNLFTWKLCWGSPGGNLNEFWLRGEMWEQYNGKQAGPATVTVTHSHCVTQPGSADYVSVVHLFHICPAPVNGSLFRVINCFLILWSSDPLQLNLITCCLASCGREEGGGCKCYSAGLEVFTPPRQPQSTLTLTPHLRAGGCSQIIFSIFIRYVHCTRKFWEIIISTII